MHFASDNWTGAHPQIMAALADANEAAHPAYGGDAITDRAIARINEVFECDAAVYFVTTGGAANGLALSVLTPPYGMVLCHAQSHIEMDECAGPEFFTGGAKLCTIPGDGGTLTVDAAAKTLSGFPERPPHGSPAHVLSLTQLTECGTAYTQADLQTLCQWAHDHGLMVHMDGARFANALATTGLTPAQMSWRAGVDVLCLGATKNGCLMAEAVIFFDKDKAKDFEFRRKRAGHLLSKHRYISTQIDAWLADNLWLDLAATANARATALCAGLAQIEAVTLWYPTDGNEVFVSFPGDVADQLRAAGAQFYPWITPGDPANGTMHRLICSYATPQIDIDRFLDLTHRLCKDV
ncbi:MAG: beta-eliminating lyase-related protein [Pseudomonadota bacterium]